MKNLRLINNAKGYKKHASKPTFVSQKIFRRNFAAIHNIKPVLKLDKQTYARFNILYFSKLLMYVFYYKYIINDCGAKLLFRDTDS